MQQQLNYYYNVSYLPQFISAAVDQETTKLILKCITDVCY